MAAMSRVARAEAVRRFADGVPDFTPGGQFTLGAEEEALLVRRSGRLRRGGAERLVATAAGRPPATGTVVPEIFANQIELNTPVCVDGSAVAHSLAELRGSLRKAGARLMVVGVHPSAGFGAVQPVSSERYDPIVAEFRGLFRTPTSSLQIHVGLPDAEAAIAAYRGLRNRLPVLRGLAAASPMWHGRDSGLASARAAIMWSYPRVRVPPAVSSYGDYLERVATSMAAAEALDHTLLWWDMRAQPQLGTLEIRVMDAQPSLDRVAGLATLVQGIARASVERPVTDDVPSEVLAEDDFRAARYGLDARVVGSEGQARPLRALAEQALAQARAALRDDGLDGPLDAIAAMIGQPTEASRQRRIVGRGRIPALLRDLVARSDGEDTGR